MISTTVAAIPTVWLLNFAEMKILNLIGITCNIIFMGAIFFLFCFNTERSKGRFDEGTEAPTAGTLSLSLGIYILSHAAHPCLPGVYNAMENKEDFSKVILYSFIIMFLVYSAVAFCGNLLYGPDTKTILTENMTDWPGGIFPQFVTT
eukprot:UN33313